MITVSTISAGVHYNIILPAATLNGTIRAFSPETQQRSWAGIRRTAKGIAESNGATAEVGIEPYVPITFNDPALTARILPTLQGVAGAQNVVDIKAVTGAEGFACYQRKFPGLFMFLAPPRPAPTSRPWPTTTLPALRSMKVPLRWELKRCLP